MTGFKYELDLSKKCVEKCVKKFMVHYSLLEQTLWHIETENETEKTDYRQQLL